MSLAITCPSEIFFKISFIRLVLSMGLIILESKLCLDFISKYSLISAFPESIKLTYQFT